MNYKVLVFVKGKSKPILFENVTMYSLIGSGLQIYFEDGSQCLIAAGQWREADVNPVKEPLDVQL